MIIAFRIGRSDVASSVATITFFGIFIGGNNLKNGDSLSGELSRRHTIAVEEALKVHQDAWRRYANAEINGALDMTDKENRFDQPWQHDHYFSVGEGALSHVMSQLLVHRRPMPSTILDFPSGSGRVTRHLRAMFPDATIGACDLYPSHIQFCAEQFSAKPLLSRENLDQLDVGEWDVIFCGSLLTHLPKEHFIKTLRFISRSLSPQGIALVTLEGRHSVYIQDNKWKLIGDELFEVAREGYDRNGFGYVDYDHDFRADKFGEQSSYGVTIVKPSMIMSMLQPETDLTILSYQERAWDDHQDLLVFGRPGVNS